MNELYSKIHKTLPIFKVDHELVTLLYVPGHIFTFEKVKESQIQYHISNPAMCPDQSIRDSLFALVAVAEKTVQRWHQLESEPFHPECLILHSGSECHLRCKYCYSKDPSTGNDRISGFPEMKMITCLTNYLLIDQQKKVSFVYHGSGEPVFHWKKLTDCHRMITIMLKRRKIDHDSYLATNGVLNDDQIRWLAKNIRLIGISCDGPPAIHKKQRSTNCSGLPSIQEVCQKIAKANGRYITRVTVTHETIREQANIVRYLIQECGSHDIRIEPVYGGSSDLLTEEDASIFCKHFEDAVSLADRAGATVGYSGIRMNELHGPFCDNLRNVLRLTPDGYTRNCFYDLHTTPYLITGKYDMANGSYHLSPDLPKLKCQAWRIPAACKECINMFHCSRGCPDYCLYKPHQDDETIPDPFKCRVHKILIINHLRRLVNNTNPEQLNK